MEDDFFVKFSDASCYEGRIHYRMVEPRERVEALLPLLQRLVQSETKPGEIHQCPICTQELKVSFTRTALNPDLGILTYCKTCNIYVHFKSNKIPLWAPEPKSVQEIIEELAHGDENS